MEADHWERRTELLLVDEADPVVDVGHDGQLVEIAGAVDRMTARGDFASAGDRIA
jgi:hypothetical protein